MADQETSPCPACGKPAPRSPGPMSLTRDARGITSHSSERTVCASCGADLIREVLPDAPWQLAGGDDAA